MLTILKTTKTFISLLQYSDQVREGHGVRLTIDALVILCLLQLMPLVYWVFDFRIVTMCDSSFEIERVLSEEEGSENEVPRNITYLLKLKDSESKTYAAVQYVLAEGKTLPYSTILKGEFSARI